jgi:hypothetical protein
MCSINIKLVVKDFVKILEKNRKWIEMMNNNLCLFGIFLLYILEKSTAEILHDFAVKVTSLNYYRSTSGAISELYARGVTECTSICNQTQGCLSFFYNKDDKICQLHDIVYENDEPSLIYVYKTYYYKMYIGNVY